jgi:hypothetical protein
MFMSFARTLVEQRNVLKAELVSFNESLGGDLKTAAADLWLPRQTNVPHRLGFAVMEQSALLVPLVFMPTAPRLPDPNRPLKFGFTFRLPSDAIEELHEPITALGELGEMCIPGTLVGVVGEKIKELLTMHHDGQLSRYWPGSNTIEPGRTVLPAPIDIYN